MTDLPAQFVCGNVTRTGDHIEHTCRRIRGHQGDHMCNCGAEGLPAPHYWGTGCSMVVYTDSFERGVAEALDREELLLARIAQMYGSGADEGRIARTLHVSLGMVRDVLTGRAKR